MSHVFISYTHEDDQFMSKLMEKLRDKGFRLWVDRDGILPGNDWQGSIDNALRLASAVVVLVTPMSRQSEYVTYEWSFAMALGIPIIPILVSGSGAEMHPKLSALQMLDFTKKGKEPWKELIECLRNSKPESQIDRVFSTREQFPDFATWLEKCEEMWISGRDLTGLLNKYYDKIDEAVKGGKILHILLVNPNNTELMQILSTSSVLRPTATDRIKVIQANIEQFTKLVSLAPANNVHLKVVDFFPMHSYVIVDSKKEHGSMTVEMFGHKIAAGKRLHMTLTRNTAPRTFDYHLQQFETMWGAGIEIFP